MAIAIPWNKILEIITSDVVINGAKDLWERWDSKTNPPPVDPQSEIKTQIEVIVKRLEALEASEPDQAKLMKEIAEQLQGVSTGLIEVSRRSSTGLWIGIGAFAISCVTLLIVLLK